MGVKFKPNWGRSINWNTNGQRGQSAEFARVQLPEPTDLTVYLSGTNNDQMTATQFGQMYRVQVGNGGMSRDLQVYAPTFGRVAHFVAQVLVVQANVPDDAIDLRRPLRTSVGVGIGRPYTTFQTVKVPQLAATDATPGPGPDQSALIPIPQFTTGIKFAGGLGGVGAATLPDYEKIMYLEDGLDSVAFPIARMMQSFVPPTPNAIQFAVLNNNAYAVNALLVTFAIDG